jgi:hypothetical protein
MSAIAGLTSSSLKTRRYVHWDDVPAEQQPALIVLGVSGLADRQFAAPTVWTCGLEVVFYLRESNDKSLTVETDVCTPCSSRWTRRFLRQPGEILIDEDPGTTLGTNASGGPMVWRCFRRTTRSTG